MHGILSNLQHKAENAGLMKPTAGETAATSTSADATTGAAVPGDATASGQEATPEEKKKFGAAFSSNPTVTNLVHQIRSLEHKYVPNASQTVKGLQISITAQKGIALDHDTLSRDLLVLNKETDSWIKDLPPIPYSGAVPVSGAEDFEIGKWRSDGRSIYAAPPTATLLNLTPQLSVLHKVLSTKLLDARSGVKALRDLEIEIENRASKLSSLNKQQAKKPSSEIESQITALEAEIKELSFGLPQKREEAVRSSEGKIWEAYGEFAKKLLVLSHAASQLVPLLPTASPTASSAGSTTPSLTPGEQRAKTRAVEEGVRKSLADLEGGWRVSIDDGGLEGSIAGTGRSSPSNSLRRTVSNNNGSSPLPPSIPHYLKEEATSPRLNPDIIGAYPSSNLSLNTQPTPLPATSPTSSGQSGLVGSGTPASPPSTTIPVPAAHKHHSSFDIPYRPSAVLLGQSPNSHSQIPERGLPPTDEEAVIDAASPPQHPTIAETGIPIASSEAGGPGPASGQLPRNPGAGQQSPEGIVRLGSLGGEVPLPSGSVPSSTVSTHDQEKHKIFAPKPENVDAAPTYTFPAAAAGPSAASGGLSGREQAEENFRRLSQAKSKEEEAKGDQLPPS